MTNLKNIADELRAEAAIADRPGQMKRLETLARWLDELNCKKRKETDMAITEGNMARERTRREVIDEMLLKAVNLARENDQVVLRLRALLVGAPPEEQRPERPTRPGWLGEIADALEVVIEHLDDTAKVLEEVSQQVATQTPTPMAPRR